MEVAVAVIERGPDVLVGQRALQGNWAGYWEFPGGKIRLTETPAAAAEREAWEETRLLVRADQLLVQVQTDYESGPSQIYFFRCRLINAGDSPRAPFLWLPRTELTRLRFPPANDTLLQMLYAEPDDSGA